MHTNVAETRRDWKDGADDRNILLIEYMVKDEERLIGWIDMQEDCSQKSMGKSTVEHGALWTGQGLVCRRGFGLRPNIHRRKSGGSGYVRVVPRGMSWTCVCV